MPRRKRLLLPGVAVHIVQRGNNRLSCFYTEEDYLYYLKQLANQAEKHGCAIHAYCLMTNHVHLLLTPEKEDGPARMMKGVGENFVRYINRSQKRTGTLWEGRYRSGLVLGARHLLACYRYIELNPVRAGMVEHPAEYRWSSYRVNAQGESSALVKSHSFYVAIHEKKSERLAAYRELFRHQLEQELVADIRLATRGNFAAGQKEGLDEIEAMAGKRIRRKKNEEAG
jgi:putative transposase